MGEVGPHFAISLTEKFGHLGTTKGQISWVVFTPRWVVDLDNQRGERTSEGRENGLVPLLLVVWLHRLQDFHLSYSFWYCVNRFWP